MTDEEVVMSDRVCVLIIIFIVVVAFGAISFISSSQPDKYEVRFTSTDNELV